MKENLRDKHQDSKKERKTAVMKRPKEKSTEFHVAKTHALIRRWNIDIQSIFTLLLRRDVIQKD